MKGTSSRWFGLALLAAVLATQAGCLNNAFAASFFSSAIPRLVNLATSGLRPILYPWLYQ
jgi:hypothetical protein